MKLLLLGRNGQVGWELQRSLAVLGELVPLGRDAATNPEGLCGDLSDLAGLAQSVRQVQPDVIVNAAAFTAVDEAESEPMLARRVNAKAPSVLATEAEKIGAWLVHYSTDYVFDGSGNCPWREDDAKAPLNVYGKAKLDGDNAVIDTCTRHLVLRTGWVYAARGRNFVQSILRQAARQDRLTVVDDQYGAPTSAAMLADVTAHCLRIAMTAPRLAGVYHCVASGKTNWHAYARFVLQQARELGWALQAGPDQVQPVPSSASPAAVHRPANSCLATDKLRSAFGLYLPRWELHVSRMLQEITVAPAQ